MAYMFAGEGIIVTQTEDNPRYFQVMILGPPDTPYEGEKYG